MIPILSQLDKIPADFFLLWSMAALVTLGVVVAVVTLWSNLRQRPPHETPTRREFDLLQKKVSEIEASLPPMERRILAAVESGSSKIETRIERSSAADHQERVVLWEKFHEANKALGERISRLEPKPKA